MNKQIKSYLWLALGSALLIVVGWRWNAPIAAWLAPVFFIRFFRTQKSWRSTLVALPVMGLGLFLNLTGSWDFSFLAEVGISLIRAIPFLLPLYLDRYLTRRLKLGAASLVYPVTSVAVDWMLALTPLGTVFSPAITQFGANELMQLTSVTGIWGITFAIGWVAAVTNLIWERGVDLKSARRPVMALAISLISILLVGGLRYASEPASATVRIGGVTVEHPRDYWGEVIDISTPQKAAHSFSEELASLEDALFTDSERAARSGARIVFWSEAAVLIYPEDEEALISRSAAFAREQGVYFVPAYVVFQYGEATADNKLVMITPEGEVAYEYTKTKSWYPTDSDGVLHGVDTPYGRLSTAICFDMDFPSFIRQAGRNDVDIMLVPSYDWEPIKPYHTYVGLYRGVENGFSVVRHVNEGTSMAVDYQGRMLAYRDFFSTPDRLMLVDVPTQGPRTFYARFGDWLAYVCIVLTASLVLVGSRRPGPR